MIVDNDVESIDNDTRENKNKIVFLILLWKIATLCTWPLKKWIQRQASTWMCLRQSIFIINGKEKYRFEKTITDFGFSSCGKHLLFSQSKKEKISKYWYNGVGTLCIGPLKIFGFNHHAYTYYHAPQPNKNPNLMCANNKNY